MIKLDIGSGGKSSDDSFLGVDAFTDADVKALMWDLPYKDGEVDVIYSSHALEHVSKYQVVPTLREWKRVLKIGGRLEIVVPDLEWACKWWLNNPTLDWNMDIIFGTQEHEGHFHKTGFTVPIMFHYINECGGFKIVGVNYLGASLEDADKVFEADEVIFQRTLDFEILRVEDTDEEPPPPIFMPYPVYEGKITGSVLQSAEGLVSKTR